MKKIKIIAFLFVLLISCIVLVGCNNGDKEDFSSNDKVKNVFAEKSEQEIINNVELNSYILEDESLLVTLKNNNDFDIKTLWIEPIFYDKDNKVTGTSKTGFKVIKSGKEVAINDFDVPKNFETYEIKLYLGEENNYISYTDKIEIESNNTGEKIVVTSINQSNKDLSILDIGIVYYKNGIPVGFSNETQYDVEKNSTTYFNILYSYDKGFDRISFDEYKVFINSAYDEY